jgi:hypothetical protein
VQQSWDPAVPRLGASNRPPNFGGTMWNQTGFQTDYIYHHLSTSIYWKSVHYIILDILVSSTVKWLLFNVLCFGPHLKNQGHLVLFGMNTNFSPEATIPTYKKLKAAFRRGIS